MDLSQIPAGKNPPNDINVVIEIPAGGLPVKYEMDKVSGALFVDRFLHTAMFYPGNYGFVPRTLSEDGDPCDVLVISAVPVIPGAVVAAVQLVRSSWRIRPAWMKSSSLFRWTIFVPITRACVPIATCRKSCASRSNTSSSTTRTWSHRNGRGSAIGSMPMRPRSSSRTGSRGQKIAETGLFRFGQFSLSKRGRPR